MATRKIKKSWWIDFRFNHVRYRKRSPLNTRAGAKAYEAALRQNLACGKSIDTERPEHRQTFEEFAHQWFTQYVIANNKHSERRSKKSILKLHLIPFFGNIPINKITAQHVEQFKLRQLSKKLKNKTINNHLTVLKKCLNTGVDWYDLTETPKIKWLKHPPPHTDFLSHVDREKLLNHSNGVWREMILTALKTGLRRGELKAIQWEDINWDLRILTVRHSWCEERKGLVSPKSNRERHIPLDAEVYSMFYQRRKNSGFVFANSNNRPFDTKTMSIVLRDVSRNAGLKNVHWHMLRHTFASHLAMANAQLGAIQILLGHASIATTMRYAHLAPSMLRPTIDLLSCKRSKMNFGQPMVNQKYLSSPIHRDLQ